MDDIALRISMRQEADRTENAQVIEVVENLAGPGGVVVFDSPQKLLAFIDLTVHPRESTERWPEPASVRG